jgi:hypothetical protein
MDTMLLYNKFFYNPDPASSPTMTPLSPFPPMTIPRRNPPKRYKNTSARTTYPIVRSCFGADWEENVRAWCRVVVKREFVN